MKGLIKKILREESKKKECRAGMYWCSDDKICKPESQRMGKIGTTEEMKEGMGFIKTYQNEVEQELDEFLDVVCSGVFELRQTKSFGDEVIASRLYGMLTDDGDLNVLINELIELLQTLPDKPPLMEPEDFYKGSGGGFKPSQY
jgi:hypothetical protein